MTDNKKNNGAPSHSDNGSGSNSDNTFSDKTSTDKSTDKPGAEQEPGNLDEDPADMPKTGVPKPDEAEHIIGTLMNEMKILQEEISQYKEHIKTSASKYAELVRQYANTVSLNTKALEEAKKYSATSLAHVALGAIDGLEMAMNIVKSNPEIFNGLKMFYDTIEQDLKKNNITRIQSDIGSMPDYNLHSVIGQVEASEQPEGSIVAVLQAGYMIHDRILRPASVNVAKQVDL